MADAASALVLGWRQCSPGSDARPAVRRRLDRGRVAARNNRPMLAPPPLRRRAWRLGASPRGARPRSRPSAAARCGSASTARWSNRAWRAASSTPSAPTPASPSCSFPGRRWRCSRRPATARSTPPSSTRPAAEAGARASRALVHDRRPIAAGEFILVGPAPREAARGRLPPPARSGVEALERIRDPGRGRPDEPRLPVRRRRLRRARRRAGALARGADRAGRALVRRRRRPGRPFTAQVRARGAYALVERGAWTARRRRAAGGRSPRATRCSPNRCTRCARSASAIRPARSSSPGSRGGRGRAVVATHARLPAPAEARAMARSGRLLSLNVARAERGRRSTAAR